MLEDTHDIENGWSTWRERVLLEQFHRPLCNDPHTPLQRTLRAWPTVANVLYCLFGIMTVGVGYNFMRYAEEVSRFGFSFLGPKAIYILGPPLVFVGALQVVTTPVRNFFVKLSIAALSVSFYASIGANSGSPTARWVYWCIAACHMLIAYPKRR